MDTSKIPQYQCHKKVRALKIGTFTIDDNGRMTIYPHDGNFGPFVVEAKYVPKHDAARPKVGWYWVLYENGYESFSPPEAFEEGYTLVKE